VGTLEIISDINDFKAHVYGSGRHKSIFPTHFWYNDISIRGAY